MPEKTEGALDEVLAFFDPGPRAAACGDHHRAATYVAAKAELRRLRSALIEIGHAVLGCDGYPCRVESDPVGYAPEMLAAIKELSRGVENAVEMDVELVRLRERVAACEAALEKIADNLDYTHRASIETIGKSAEIQATADAQMHAMVLSCESIARSTLTSESRRAIKGEKDG